MSINYMGATYGPLTKNQDGIINVSVKHTFLFTAHESPQNILAHADVPPIRSELSEGLFATLISISAPQEGDEVKKSKYIVTVQYSNDLSPETPPSGGPTNIAPWKLPPYDVSIFGVEIVKSLTKSYTNGDAKGTPSVDVVNAAGDPFDAQTVEQNTIYKFSYNLRDFRDSWIDDFLDTTNNADIAVIEKTIPLQKGRMRNLSSAYQTVYNSVGKVKYNYWRVDVEIEKSADYWQVEFMNRGLWIKDSDSKRLRIYTDGDGHFDSKAALKTAYPQAYTDNDIVAVDTPQKLSEDGATVVDEANYITFSNKEMVNWQPLSLPKNLR